MAVAPSLGRRLRVLDENDANISSLVDSLASEPALALDTESDPFHRYFEKVCLIQISTPEEDFIVDTLAVGLPDGLRALLEDPRRMCVLHGADYDVRCLRRSFDLVLGRLFDTLIAANLLGFKALGLKALLESELGVVIQKTEQRSDWGRRPLSQVQLEYARQDTMHLFALAAKLTEALSARGRVAWMEEECDLLRIRSASPRVFDAEGWRKLKGAKQLGEHGKRALRGAYLWREDRAQAVDRPPFRILRNEAMLALAALIDQAGVPDVASMKRLRYIPRSLDHAALWDAIRRALSPLEGGVEALSGTSIAGDVVESRADPAPGPLKDPVAKRRLERLRAQRIEWAKALALDPGFLISGNVLERLAREPPASIADLLEVRGMTAWRAEAVGREILDVLKK